MRRDVAGVGYNATMTQEEALEVLIDKLDRGIAVPPDLLAQAREVAREAGREAARRFAAAGD
jgi:hypothetical protein